MILAGDVGGTKTRLALYSREGGPRAPLAEETFASDEYTSLEAAIREFRAALGIERAVLGVAGPVIGGRARITNLPWVIEEAALATELGTPGVLLLNDLQAVAYAVDLLAPEELHTLAPGSPDPAGAIALVAPGTGLGEAYLVRGGGRGIALPSEGGHTDFAPETEAQAGLLAHLRAQFGHVSYERICSGIGLPNVYGWLRESGAAEEPDWLARELEAAADVTPVIIQAAMARPAGSELCVMAVELFAEVLAAEAGNLALTVLATGGVYVGGGIPPRILPYLEDGRFTARFRSKGRMEPWLGRVPVHVILNPDAALLGAARCALDQAADR